MTQATGNELSIEIDLKDEIVRGERDLLPDTALPGLKGARAALETFYYAFNTRSLDLLHEIWADDPLAQLDTPFVGLIRGSANIAATYAHAGSAVPKMRTALHDIVAFVSPGLAIFTQRENATQEDGHNFGELSGRSSCIFRFTPEKGWRLIYHQISLDGHPANSQRDDQKL